MNAHSDIHPDWEISETEDSVQLRRENALLPIQDAIPGNSTTIVVEFDEAGARVSKPEPTLQLTHESDPPSCAITLTQFIDRQLSFAFKQPPGAETRRKPEEIVNSLAVYRDLPPHLRTQALSLFTQYQDNTEKQWVADMDNLAAAAILTVERLNGRRAQYADFNLPADCLFAELTNITTHESECVRQARELQRTLPINIDVLHDPVAEIDRVDGLLELPTGIKDLACELADNHTDCMPEASAYKPHSIAGAAIYNAVRYYNREGSHEVHYTQSEIASALGCSSASIRAHYESQWDNVTKTVKPPKVLS